MHLALHQGTPGEIYNIGAGNETPNRVLVDKLLALVGQRRGARGVRHRPLGPRPALLGRHRQDHRARLAQKRTLDEALAETVEWYRANRWWWEPLKDAAHEEFS